jgi:hypothetical protein
VQAATGDWFTSVASTDRSEVHGPQGGRGAALRMREIPQPPEMALACRSEAYSTPVGPVHRPNSSIRTTAAERRCQQEEKASHADWVRHRVGGSVQEPACSRCDTLPPRRYIGAERVQAGVSTAPAHVPMRNPSRTPLAFSGVDMMPVLSATKDRYVAADACTIGGTFGLHGRQPCEPAIFHPASANASLSCAHPRIGGLRLVASAGEEAP